MTFDVSQAPIWIGIYIASAFAAYTLGRYEVGRIEDAGERFHNEFAERVHELQRFALREITQRLPVDYPTIKKLISTPQQAPSDDTQESELRKELDLASDEIESIGRKLKGVAEPDRLFKSISNGYEEKSRTMNRVLVESLAASIVIPVIYTLALFVEPRTATLVSLALVYAAVLLLAGVGTFGRARHLTGLSGQIKEDRKTLTEEIDTKIHHIRRVDLEVPPPKPEGGEDSAV